MARFDRKRLKSGIKESIEYSNKTKDSRGASSRQPLDWDAMEKAGYIKYKPDAKKTNYISIIPYMPGDNDPRQGKLQESKRKSTHFLDFWTHKIVSKGDIYVCPKSTYGAKCPMCEYIEANKGKLDREQWMEVRPIRRALYAIFDENDPDSFVKYWYTPYNSIEVEIQNIVQDERTGEITYFTDPEEGTTVSFKFEDKGNFNWNYTGFGFKERKYEVSDELLEFVSDNPLDSFLIPTDYKEFSQAFDPYGSAVVEEELDKYVEREEEEEEKPKRTSRKRELVCPIEDGIFGKDFNEFEECTECDIFEKCAEKFEELEEEEEEKPKKPSKKVEEDYEEEEEEEEHTRTSRKGSRDEEETSARRPTLRRRSR